MNDQAIEKEIQAKGLTAPRVTPADIEANIAGEYYFSADDGAQGAHMRSSSHFSGVPTTESMRLLTFCVLVLRNGFTVTGESACASPENFDAEIGRKTARTNAINKVWPLMGYALKHQLHAAANQPPAPGAAHAGYSALAPHQQRVVDERAELGEKLAKLEAFVGTPLFDGLPEAERGRLIAQHGAMFAYSSILKERIAAFAPATA